MQADSALQLTDETFEKEVNEFPGLTIVDFWAPWCGPCRMMTPIIEQLAKKYADNAQVKIAQMNIDESPQVPNSFQVMSIPTLIAFVNGERVDVAVGAKPLPVVEEMIKRNAPAPAAAAA